MLKINIAQDFSDAPGGRYSNEGLNSGEEFRKSWLEPLYSQAKEKGEKIEVNLDGGYGYLPSFLDEAFGELARLNPSENVAEVFVFISNDEPGLIDDIVECMKNKARTRGR